MWIFLALLLIFAIPILGPIAYRKNEEKIHELWPPKFMRSKVVGQIIVKQFEEVQDDVAMIRRGSRRARKRSYMNYFIVLQMIDKKQLGFNISKLDYDMIQERKWYTVIYYKDKVYDFIMTDKPSLNEYDLKVESKEIDEDPFSDYYNNDYDR